MSVITIDNSLVARNSQTPDAILYSPNAKKDLETPNRSSSAADEGLIAFLKSLREVTDEAAQDGWDGLNSKKVNSSALSGVGRFLLAFPASLPLGIPQIMEDGRVLLEWTKGPRVSLLLLFGASSRAHFASFIRGATIHGTFNLGDELPKEFVAAIRGWNAAN